MQLTSFQEAREYLETFIRPMLFQKITLRDGKLSDPLDRMRVLLELLGNPEKSFPSVVITGSAGKGSTAYLLSHILTTAGFKTGLSISPHLQLVTERMQVQGIPATDDEFVTLMNEIQPIIQQMKQLPVGEPSYFEILLALAFIHFAKKKIDIAIIEVGIEGKYDGTNVLDPLLIVLTNIGLDHIEILGDTVEKIAYEAVASIKNKQIVITGVTQHSVEQIVARTSEKQNAKLVSIGKTFHPTVLDVTKQGTHFDFTSSTVIYKNLVLSLIGKYQVTNAALALEAIQQLSAFNYRVSELAIRTALKTATFPGRFEFFEYEIQDTKYKILLDGAHNPMKMEAFLSSLETLYPEKKKIFITTFKKGKMVEEMLTMIARVADILVLTEFHRTIDTEKNASMKIDDLAQKGEKLLGITPQIINTRNTQEALKAACQNADEGSLIVVTGSLYLVGEIREIVELSSAGRSRAR